MPFGICSRQTVSIISRPTDLASVVICLIATDGSDEADNHRDKPDGTELRAIALGSQQMHPSQYGGQDVCLTEERP